MLGVADLVLAGAGATAPAHAFVGTAFRGLHMGLTQGLLSKLVAATAAATLRGTAFGVFNLVSGVALLPLTVSRVFTLERTPGSSLTAGAPGP